MNSLLRDSELCMAASLERQTTTFTRHPGADALEKYLLGSITEGGECEAIECHLLICADCQDELMDLDIFTTLLRMCQREIDSKPPSRLSRQRSRPVRTL